MLCSGQGPARQVRSGQQSWFHTSKMTLPWLSRPQRKGIPELITATNPMPRTRQDSDKSVFVLIRKYKNIWKHMYHRCKSYYTLVSGERRGAYTSYLIQASRRFHPSSVNYFSNCFKRRYEQTGTKKISKNIASLHLKIQSTYFCLLTGVVDFWFHHQILQNWK